MHPDHLGSAVAGSNSSGGVAWRELYSPFGIASNLPGANDNRDGFTGHIRDKATGLTYMQARYYDPITSRFLSIDPVSFVSSGGDPSYFNRYAYAYNNPVNAIDPDGRSGKILRFVYKAFKHKGNVKKAASETMDEVGSAVATVLNAEASFNDRADAVVQLVTGLPPAPDLTVANESAEGERELGELETIDAPGHNEPRPGLEGLSDEELTESVNNPADGQKVKVRGNKVRDGNGRLKEMKKRGFAEGTKIPVTELPDDKEDFSSPEYE